MKKFTFGGMALVLAAFFGMLAAGSPSAFARPSAVASMGQKQQTKQGKQPVMAPYRTAEVFWGTITRQNGRYVLTVGQFTYKLSNQAKARKYNGKVVQITGKLNPKTNKITVLKMKKAGMRQ